MAAVTSGKASSVESATQSLAKTCYSLGLVSRTGQPT